MPKPGKNKLFQQLYKSLRQAHILKSNRLCKQRGNFFVPKSCNPATNTRYIEEQFWVFFGKSYLFSALFDVLFVNLPYNCVRG